MKPLFHGPLFPMSSITTAQTDSVGKQVTLREVPQSIKLIPIFIYGSGGTDIKVYVQTTGDPAVGPTTWVDIARFDFTTQSGIGGAQLSSTTDITSATAFGQTGNHVLAADTAVGPFGHAFRVVYTSTGTYGGGTLLRVDLIAAR